MKTRIFLLLISVVIFFGFSSRQNILGTWENAENIIDAKPGEIQIVFRIDGTGSLIFDKDVYFWVADKFMYQMDKNKMDVSLVYEDGDKSKPQPIDLIKLNSQELIIGEKLSGLKFTFRKVK